MTMATVNTGNTGGSGTTGKGTSDVGTKSDYGATKSDYGTAKSDYGKTEYSAGYSSGSGMSARGTVGAEQGDLRDRARELARDTRSQLLDRANEVGSRGMTAVGDKLEQAAGYFDRRVGGIEGEDTAIVGRAGNVVAERLHGAARYLRDKDPRSVLTSIDEGVYAHPYRAMFIGAGIGWVIGRLMSRSE
jgi:ElaB/YqjD/DUF883 family membrane-anchored ribosome-binding protein